MCPCETLRAKVSLRVQYLDVSCDTKTKDNVFVRVVVAGTHFDAKLRNDLILVISPFSAIQSRRRKGSQRLLQTHRS